MRYRRQAYELTVPMADGAVTRASLDALAAAFHARHHQTYGHANPAEPVQLVNIRLTAIGHLSPLKLAPSLAGSGEFRASRRREAYFPQSGFVPCPVYWRGGLTVGATPAGPVIVEAMDSTIVVPPGWIATVDGGGYIRLRRR